MGCDATCPALSPCSFFLKSLGSGWFLAQFILGPLAGENGIYIYFLNLPFFFLKQMEFMRNFSTHTLFLLEHAGISFGGPCFDRVLVLLSSSRVVFLELQNAMRCRKKDPEGCLYSTLIATPPATEILFTLRLLTSNVSLFYPTKGLFFFALYLLIFMLPPWIFSLIFFSPQFNLFNHFILGVLICRIQLGLPFYPIWEFSPFNRGI